MHVKFTLIMKDNTPIQILADSALSAKRMDCLKIIGLEIELFGRNINFQAAITEEQAALSDIVPLSRVVSTNIALAVLKKLQETDTFVPCRKGCSACCRYLIPLSVPEVFRLRQEILSLPADKRKLILNRILESAELILQSGFRNFETTGTPGNFVLDHLGKWYAELQLSCPLMDENLCIMYAERPTACREHIVTASASLCQLESFENPNVVEIPFSINEALGQLAGELEGTEVEAVMLPLSVPWADDNLARSKRKWPTVMMVERFFGILKTLASQADQKIPAGVA
ncbi:MAG: YkgJ family cysteine cluster protein [Planctomycetota bacterium]|jgi:Fe-S-cluster containining protein